MLTVRLYDDAYWGRGVGGWHTYDPGGSRKSTPVYRGEGGQNHGNFAYIMAKIKPAKPGFLAATKPGFSGLRIGG